MRQGHFSAPSHPGAGRVDRKRHSNVGWFSTIELLASLLLYIIVIPFLSRRAYGEFIATVLLTVVLLAAIGAAAGSRRTLAIGLVLAVPAFGAKWANYFRPDIVPLEVSLVATICFVAFVAFCLFGFIFSAPRVDLRVLAAAASNYLLIGLLWMFLYLLLAHIIPESFSFGGQRGTGGLAQAFDILYFSFVTLNTVGYGDITPLSAQARMLSILEASIGTFYVTIVIARLVSLYSSPRVEAPGGDQTEYP